MQYWQWVLVLVDPLGMIRHQDLFQIEISLGMNVMEVLIDSHVGRILLDLHHETGMRCRGVKRAGSPFLMKLGGRIV